MMSIRTDLGVLELIVLPGAGNDDAWWVCVDAPPTELSEGGPTVACAATADLAAGVLAVAINRFCEVQLAVA